MPCILNNPIQAALLDEANKSFDLNLNLFSTLKPPKYQKPTNRSAISLLGDSESDIEEDDGDLGIESKEIPIEIIHEDGQPQESMISMVNFIAIMVAVCLAHIFLVTWGLTGTAWIEKLKSMGLLES